MKVGAPSGEIGMTSLPVIEKRPITHKPLQIGVSFLLTTNRKSLVCFQDMGSDLKFGDPSGEIGMTSFPVIENAITPKPLQIDVSFLLNTKWAVASGLSVQYQHNKVIKQKFFR